jgi:hypothetical protein
MLAMEVVIPMIPADSESGAVMKMVSLEMRFMKRQVPVSKSYR